MRNIIALVSVIAVEKLVRLVLTDPVKCASVLTAAGLPTDICGK